MEKEYKWKGHCMRGKHNVAEKESNIHLKKTPTPPQSFIIILLFGFFA